MLSALGPRWPGSVWKSAISYFCALEQEIGQCTGIVLACVVVEIGQCTGLCWLILASTGMGRAERRQERGILGWRRVGSGTWASLEQELDYMCWILALFAGIQQQSWCTDLGGTDPTASDWHSKNPKRALDIVQA